MQSYIYSRLLKYHEQNRISFAMPGHKNLRGFDGVDFMKCDVTELPETADLVGGSDDVSRANDSIKQLYGTRESFILTCGSTICIKIMIASALKPGDTLLITPDCHMSVINACGVMGVNMRMEANITDEKITHDIGAVLVTSPNYYGVTKDIASIAEVCRKKGVMLLVDEAHGAHFTGKYGLPKSAVAQGADMVCQSAHKTLNALTGGAYLHICTDKPDRERVKRNIGVFHTSSPSYPIAASAEMAASILKDTDYSKIIDECRDFKESVVNRTAISVFNNNDPTRIVLDFSSYGIRGFDVSDILSEKYAIDVEMADLYNIVLIVTPMNTHSDFETLFSALLKITGSAKKTKATKKLPLPPVCCDTFSPRLGMFSRREKCGILNSVGKRAADTVMMYPPGTAIVAAGQIITDDAAKYIDKLTETGADIRGINKGMINVIV